MNKTGTTSLKKALKDLGFKIGSQITAENLLPEYMNGNFEAIIKHSKTAQVFQDIPFSLPHTYEHLAKHYPNAYFILTVRDSPEQWYESLIKFHSKLFGKNDLPTNEQLKNSEYVYKGFIWDCLMAINKSSQPYDFTKLTQSYKEHNEDVERFFKNKEYNFLKLNLSDKQSYRCLVDFLDIDSPFNEFPWKNKTSEIDIK